MNAVKGQLVGYRRFTSKKNVEFCVGNVMMPCSQRDVENGYVGNRVDEMFLPGGMVVGLILMSIAHLLGVVVIHLFKNMIEAR